MLWSKEHGRKVLAHRYSYELHRGVTLRPGQGSVVQHSCDNPRCVNPAHLTLGTMKTNYADMAAKGRRRIVVCPSNKPPIRLGEAHHKAKLTDGDVQAIRADVAAGKSYASIARERGMHKSTIRRAAIGAYWRHVT